MSLPISLRTILASPLLGACISSHAECMFKPVMTDAEIRECRALAEADNSAGQRQADQPAEGTVLVVPSRYFSTPTFDEVHSALAWEVHEEEDAADFVERGQPVQYVAAEPADNPSGATDEALYALGGYALIARRRHHVNQNHAVRPVQEQTEPNRRRVDVRLRRGRQS